MCYGLYYLLLSKEKFIRKPPKIKKILISINIMINKTASYQDGQYMKLKTNYN